MTRAEAIRRHCKECAGDSALEAALCVCFDCLLWPFRLGCGMESSAYRRRVESALASKVGEEVRGLGLSMGDFTRKGHVATPGMENDGRRRVGPRGADGSGLGERP